MKTTTINIDGVTYQLDVEAATKQGLLRRDHPMTWEEVEKVHGLKNKSIEEVVSEYYGDYMNREIEQLIKLLILRNEWTDEWMPNWNDASETKYCIIYVGEERGLTVITLSHFKCLFSFPTKQMAEEFLITFKDRFSQLEVLI